MPRRPAAEPPYATQRRDAIAQELAATGRVAVRVLAERFGVSAETVRRDLDALSDSGLAVRVHGGAVGSGRLSPTGSAVESGMDARLTHASAAKKRIAQAATAFIPDEAAALLLDSGTTTGALAGLLPGRANISVLTNSVPIAASLSGRHPGVVSLIGGQVRGLTQACVGGQAVATLGHIRADVAFVGTNGVSADFGLSTPDIAEGHTKRAIVRAARRVIVLADSRKFGQEYLMQFADWQDVDLLLTDAPPPSSLADALTRADIHWVVAR